MPSDSESLGSFFSDFARSRSSLCNALMHEAPEHVWEGWSPALARGYVAPRITDPPLIDGRVAKAPWLDIPWTEDFLDIQGEHNPPPRFRTRAKMCWDDEHLYIAAEMEELHVWATLTQRDSVIFHDNDFEVFIDPDGDHCDYYELEINALRTVWDLRLPRPYRDGGAAIDEWDIAGLRTAVHIDGTVNDPRDVDRGWTVEIAIPWKALAEFSSSPAPPRDGDQWRINFSRVQWQTRAVDGRYEKLPGTPEDNWVWSPQGVIDMHRPERWGYVQFTAAPPGAAVPFRPDPLGDAKWYLQRFHEAQKVHKASAGTWARDVAVLAVPRPADVQVLSLTATAEGYAITITSHGWLLCKDSTGRLSIL